MDDGFSELGLTEFADPSDNLTEGQEPYCPIPQRVQPAPLWGYRWRSYLPADGNAEPEDYVTLQSTEYRLGGAAAYEITLQEDVAWFDAADAFPLPINLPLVQGVSGLARLRVVSGGFSGERFHHGRQTLIVNGEYVFVDVQVPTRAVVLDSVPVPLQGAGQSTAITVSKPTVRVVAVPARSRRPSEWRIADMIFVNNIATFTPIRLAPGISDVRVLGADRFSVSVRLLATSTASSPFTIVTSGPIEENWIPVDGSSHLGFNSIQGQGGTLVVEQRGWM